jgi:hypothetical protein
MDNQLWQCINVYPVVLPLRKALISLPNLKDAGWVKYIIDVCQEYISSPAMNEPVVILLSVISVLCTSTSRKHFLFVLLLFKDVFNCIVCRAWAVKYKILEFV